MSRQLDHLQDTAYAASGLAGDRWIEFVCSRPASAVSWTAGSGVDVAPLEVVDLDGEWLLASSEPHDADVTMVDWPSTWMHMPGGGGPAWWRQDTDRSSWRRVRVPTTVQNALIEAGDVADPNWAGTTHDELVQHGRPTEWPWQFRRTRVEQRDWWFAREFFIPGEWAGSRVELRFEGVSYSASIFVNGQSLGNHQGMFGGPTLDITGLIRLGGQNSIVVRVDAPPMHWYGRPIGSAGYGWHYGHLIPVGLWRSVLVRRMPAVALRDLRVGTESVSEDGNACLRVVFDIENAGEISGDLSVQIQFKGPGSESVFATQVPVSSAYHRWEGSVDIPNAALWWPVGFGDQPLYTVLLSGTFISEAGSTSAGVLSRRVGIRVARMATVADWTGEDFYRWQLVVNGVPIYMKGANWCSSDPLLRGEPEKYRDILDACVDANIQVLRAWGAGVVESDYFYDLCDERGILVYQEFPFTWGPPDSPFADLGVVDRQVYEIVARLRHHPSIFMWGGGNENLGAVGADEVLFLAGRRARQLDPDRPYHRSDPWGGSEHNYLVFHGGLPIDEGYQSMNPVLYGEWGLPSLPSSASLARYLDDTSRTTWPPREDDGAVLQHQPEFRLFDFVKQARYANYGPITDWDLLVEYTQLAQMEALRFAANYIRGSSPGHTAGFWFYKVTDLFPGNSWSVFDFYGSPKPAYYAAKRVCRNMAGFLVASNTDVAAEEALDVAVWAANDLTSSESGVVRVTVYDAHLAVRKDEEFRFELAPFDRARVGEVFLDGNVHRGQVLLIRVSTRGDGRADMGEDWYWFNARSSSDAIRAIEATPLQELRQQDRDIAVLKEYARPRPAPLRELPRTTIEATIAPAAGRWDITIRNVGDVPAFPVAITGLAAGSGSMLSDNWFGLAPGCERLVALGTGETPPPLVVSSWNANAVGVQRRDYSEGRLS